MFFGDLKLPLPSHLPALRDAPVKQRVNESMSVEDMVAFLSSHMIPGRFCEAIEGNAKLREKCASKEK